MVVVEAMVVEDHLVVVVVVEDHLAEGEEDKIYFTLCFYFFLLKHKLMNF
jgi:hypothetical protein